MEITDTSAEMPVRTPGEALGSSTDGFASLVHSRRGFLAGVGAASALLVGFGIAGCSTGPSAGRPTIDCYQGLLAFLVPGSDGYSQQQGVMRPGPGGVSERAERVLAGSFNEAFPVPISGPGIDITVPLELFIAQLLDNEARLVAPASGAGPFASPFANLSFDDKVEVFRRLESEQLYDGTFLRYLLNTVPTFAGFVALSEVATFDPTTRTLTGRPASWDVTAYPGVADGRNELVGYYRGVSSTD